MFIPSFSRVDSQNPSSCSFGVKISFEFLNHTFLLLTQKKSMQKKRVCPLFSHHVKSAGGRPSMGGLNFVSEKFFLPFERGGFFC